MKNPYIHLGMDFLIPKADIVGIFDMDNASSSPNTKRFLKTAGEQGRVVDAAGDLPRSFAVATSYTGERVYLSQLSSATLARRWNSGRPEPLPPREKL